MASFRSRPQRTDVRAQLADRFRALAHTYRDFAGREPWTALADHLDAGKPLLVAGWQVCRWSPADPRAFYVLEPDGCLVPAGRSTSPR